MEWAQLRQCRFSADDPLTYGIGIDQERAERDQKQARARLLADAVKIDSQVTPRLHEILTSVSQKLRLQQPISGYVYNDPAIQAACVHVGGQEKAALMLSSGLINLMSEDELTFVIGHELGHMVFDHGLYPSPESASDDSTRFNWLALKRAAEISADRVGFLASRSVEATFKAILKTGTGLGNEHLRFDLAAFLDQLRTLGKLGGDTRGIASSHPILTVRMKAVLWFEMSDFARKVTRKGGQGLCLEAVDARIERLMDDASGQLLERVRSESFARAAMWTLLYAAVSDGRLSLEDQQGIQRLFGQSAVEGAIEFLREHGPERVGARFEDAMREIRFHPGSGRRSFLGELKTSLDESGFPRSDSSRILRMVADRLQLDD